MTTKLLFAACIALASLCAIQAQTDGLVAQETVATASTSQVERELIETLNTAFEQALHKYKSDVNGEPDAAIRLNEKLYEAQIQTAEQNRQVVEGYLSRATQVEAIANARLADGRGTSTTMLEARAARLKAMRELAALPQ